MSPLALLLGDVAGPLARPTDHAPAPYRACVAALVIDRLELTAGPGATRDWLWAWQSQAEMLVKAGPDFAARAAASLARAGAAEPDETMVRFYAAGVVSVLRASLQAPKRGGV